jgi:hypothetical protein
MAQYIRTPFENDNFPFGLDQVSQIVYHSERVITIDFDTNTNRVLVQNNGETFWLTSPDIAAITMRNVFEHLGYAHEQIVLTYPEDESVNNVLDAPVQQAPLNQMAIYAPNEAIPAQHPDGPFPAVAGGPVPDAPNPNAQLDFGPFQAAAAPAPDAPDAPQPDDDDDNSTLSDIPNFRFVEHFGDSDNDDYYHRD